MQTSVINISSYDFQLYGCSSSRFNEKRCQQKLVIVVKTEAEMLVTDYVEILLLEVGYHEHT